MKMHSRILECSFLVNVQTFTFFLFLALTPCVVESAESRLCAVPQHNPILQRQKASWITNDSLKVMSNVENVCPTCMAATDLLKYLSQACKLLNVLFWCQFLLVCLCYCWHYSQSPRPRENLIEVEPISPYTVFTQTQSSAALFPPALSLCAWTFAPKKHLQTHTNFPQLTHQTVNSSPHTWSQITHS